MRRKILRDATDDLDNTIKDVTDLSKTCCKTDMRDNLTFIRQIERTQHERKDHLHLVAEKCQTYKQQGVNESSTSVPDCWKFRKPQISQLDRIIVDDVHKVSKVHSQTLY